MSGKRIKRKISVKNIRNQLNLGLIGQRNWRFFFLHNHLTKMGDDPTDILRFIQNAFFFLYFYLLYKHTYHTSVVKRQPIGKGMAEEAIAGAVSLEV